MLAIAVVIVSLFTNSGSLTKAPLHDSDSVKRPGKARVVEHRSDSGRFLHINRIFVIGNKITRDQIILRELTLKPGDIVFSEDLNSILETDKKKVYNTRLFNTVGIKSLDLDNNEIDLLVDVTERWYTFPVPIFELSDRNFNEWWQNYNHDFNRVNYGVKLYQYNFRGRNETILATAQFGFTRNFSLTYRLPYIDKKQKQGLVFTVDFKENKNLAYKTTEHKLVFLEGKELLQTSNGFGVTYNYRNSFYDTHSFKAEYRRTNIADTIAQLNPIYLLNENTRQEYIALHYGFTSDHRDVIAYPLRGRYLYASASQFGLGLQDDVSKTEISFNYARYFDLGNNYFFSNYSFANWSTADNQPYNFFGGLGYSKKVIRGYEIYVIEGPYSFINKSTLKKRIFSRNYKVPNLFVDQFSYIPLAIYVKTYADFGYVRNYSIYEQNDLNTRFSNQFLLGFGTGIDVVTSYDTVLRFEYSINHEGKGGFFFNVKKEF